MKCWCFNEEQLEAGLNAWAERQRMDAAVFHQNHVEGAKDAIRKFLNIRRSARTQTHPHH